MESTTFLNALSLPATASVGDPTSLYAALQRIRDPRQRRGRRYSLALVLTLIVLGKLAGETTLSGIAQWARLRTDWLTAVFALPRPCLPCANTYTWLSNQVAVDELNTVLAEFFVPPLPALRDSPPAPPAAPPRGQRHLALDGKTLRGTRGQGTTPQAAVHLLELYDVTHRGMLAQLEVATQEHEVPCAAQLLAGYDLAGCVVTADALHTQRDWCAQVIAQRGDYVLIAKENQPGLRADIAFLFEGTWPPWLEQRTVTTVNKGHGRIEVRHLRASTELQDLLEDQWTGLAQVFQLERERIRHGTCTHEVVYGISSLPAADAGPERLLSLVRAHWQLENRVHWRKDVTLREDASHVRAGHAPQVLAALNNAVLALMDQRNVQNIPAQMRAFAALPATALALLMSGP